MPSDRSLRVGELIQRELTQLLLREIELPEGTLATVTRVKVDPELKEAKVYVSVLPFGRRYVVFNRLKKVRKSLQKQINSKLYMYSVPKIEFVIDDTEEKASIIDKLLDSTPPEA